MSHSKITAYFKSGLIVLLSLAQYDALKAQNTTAGRANKTKIEITTLSGRKISGTNPIWKDSWVSIELIIPGKGQHRITPVFHEIKQIKFVRNKDANLAIGATVGAVGLGGGTVAIINSLNGVSNGWDPTPMFGLMGGCCLGGIGGAGAGILLSTKFKMYIGGDLLRFQKAAATWKNRYGGS
ncbi:MAG: hypothetical protein JNL57_12995 [Bacteroidetes bacterium]|nr:hypothetical protein [Bacteroidota bacterium]